MRTDAQAEHDRRHARASRMIEEGEACFKAAADFHASIASAFEPTSKIQIEYENLLRDPEACVATVFDFLNVPPLKLLRPRHFTTTRIAR